MARKGIFYLRAFGAFAFLWILHLSLRLPLLKNGLWLDEAAAGLVILENENFLSLRNAVNFLYQPLLDFILRKYFWYQIFGISELSFRFVSIFYSSLNLAVWFFGTLQIFAKNRSYALSSAFILGIWFCFLHFEIEQAGEARTYALVGLLSTAWFFSFYFFQKSEKWFFFLLFTLLFLNSHFFSIPIVIFVVGMHSLEMFRKEERKKSILLISSVLCVLAFTIALNFPSVFELLNSNVSSIKSSESKNQFSHALFFMLNDLWLFAKTFQWSYFGFPILFSLIFMAIFRRSGNEESRLAIYSLLLIFVFFPLFFLNMRLSTEFPLKTRYLLPFLGFSLFPFLHFLKLFQKSFQLNKLFARLLVRAVVIFSVVYSFQFIDLKVGSDLFVKGSEFSQTKKFFNQQKLKGNATFSIAFPCWCRDISNIYWNQFNPNPKAGDFLNSGTFHPKDCEQTNFIQNSEMRLKFREFLKKNRDVDVILVDCSGGCRGGGDSFIQDSRACLSLINQIRSEDALLRAMQENRFPAQF